MRAILVMMVVMAAGPALACRGMSDEDCRASRARDQADHDLLWSEMKADARAQDQNRRLRAIEREVQGLRDDLTRRPVEDNWLPTRDFPARRY